MVTIDATTGKPPSPTIGARRESGPVPSGVHGLELAVWEALKGVKDPEIPVIDVVELGVVRSVTIDDLPEPHVSVTITPTFSACPALHEIERSVKDAVLALGVDVSVHTTLAPPWTTDDMTDEAREKLRRFGIAPPGKHGGLIEIALDAPVRCPRCDHPDTRLRNAFGSTLCREIRTCAACDETFERFKPL